jgi:putative oxidoreductase
MVDPSNAPYGVFLLRVSMGVMFILHGAYLKVMVIGMTGTAQYFASLGLPAWFAWVAMLYETIGGVALIAGLYVRLTAFVLGIHLLVAAYVGHAANGWLFSNDGGGYEFPLFWAITCFALALISGGANAPGQKR